MGGGKLRNSNSDSNSSFPVDEVAFRLFKLNIYDVYLSDKNYYFFCCEFCIISVTFTRNLFFPQHFIQITKIFQPLKRPCHEEKYYNKNSNN